MGILIGALIAVYIADIAHVDTSKNDTTIYPRKTSAESPDRLKSPFL